MEELLRSIIKEVVKDAVMEVLEEVGFKKPEEVLSVADLCKWLGCSKAWVSTNINKLNIPHYDMGGIKFNRSDILKWIEENKSDAELERPAMQKINIKVASKKLRIS